MKKSVYDIVTQRIMEKLEQGTIPRQRPWIGGGAQNLISKKEYRGINVFLLAGSGYSSPYFVTYKQAESKGGQVKKSEKGHIVVFWKQLKMNTTDKAGETIEKTIPMLRYYMVFNTDQCEGLEVPETEKLPRFKAIDCCEKIVEEMPNCPKITHNEARACYIPTDDRVNMPKKDIFRSSEEYYSTLFHELTHSTGHETRLNRKPSDIATHFGNKEYSKEELVAEMGAAFLCGHCQIENKTIDNSAAYIKGWLKKLKNDTKLIVQAAGLAQKASDFILNN